MSGEALLRGVGPFQPVARALAGPALRSYFRLDVEGAANVPASGPAILAPNHDSMWDVPIVVVASPRPIVFMAKEDVFDRPFKRWLFTRLGGFPVTRGGADTAAMKTSLAALGGGRLLCLYPEGTRRAGVLLPFLPGVARLALMTGSPIVPVGIVGTGQVWRRGSMLPRRARIGVRFGEAIEVQPEHRSRWRAELVPALTERVRGAVAGLLGGA